MNNLRNTSFNETSRWLYACRVSQTPTGICINQDFPNHSRNKRSPFSSFWATMAARPWWRITRRIPVLDETPRWPYAYRESQIRHLLVSTESPFPIQNQASACIKTEFSANTPYLHIPDSSLTSSADKIFPMNRHFRQPAALERIVPSRHAHWYRTFRHGIKSSVRTHLVELIPILKRAFADTAFKWLRACGRSHCHRGMWSWELSLSQVLRLPY